MRRERDKKLIREEWDKMPNEEKKNIERGKNYCQMPRMAKDHEGLWKLS